MGKAFHGQDLPPTYFRMMLYGPVGTGKTSLALTFPDPFMLAMAWEGGAETARGKDVTGFIAEDWDEVDSVVDKFCAQYEKKGFGTFVFDGLSFARRLLEENVKGRASDMTMQRWGVFSKKIEGVIHKLALAERAHVVFTAHVDEVKAEGGGIIAGKVLWPGSSGKVTIPGTMTELLHMDVIKAKDAGTGKMTPTYRTFFRKHGVYDARIRYAPRDFPDYADDLTFDGLVALLAKYGIPVAGARDIQADVPLTGRGEEDRDPEGEGASSAAAADATTATVQPTAVAVTD